MTPVLEVRSISKSFGSNLVLRDVSFDIDEGHIYGIMGANGAGKSTLIKILSGAEQPDEGQVILDGERVSFRDPLSAQRAGIATVHQNPNDGVVLDMTVAENLALDLLSTSDAGRGFTRRRVERQARDVASILGMTVSSSLLRSTVRSLGVSDRQLIVLARALSRRPKVLILDEPTSALSHDETLRLFGLVKSMAASGVTILFVTHKLAEFDQLCHHVGALRDGVMLQEFYRGDEQTFPWPEVLEVLFDRQHDAVDRPLAPPGKPAATFSGVQVFPRSHPLDMTLYDGHVTVLLGLLGSGKSELLEWAFGARALGAGERTLGGRSFSPRHPKHSIRSGVYLVPESRHEQAIIPGWGIAAQMTLPFLRQFSPTTFMRRKEERRTASRMMERLGVIAGSASSSIATLSGGNQQKVTIGRWLLGAPRVLLLDEPFRGVDINARHDIGETIRELAVDAAVLVATSDLDEALEVGDRFIVINHGTLMCDLSLAEVTRDRLITAMSEQVPEKPLPARS